MKENKTASMFDRTRLYHRWKVKIRILERMDGGVPKDKSMIKKWVEAKTGFADEQSQKLAEEHLPDIEALTEAESKGLWTGFKKDSTGHYIESRQIKAMFRECFVVCGITGTKRGSRQILQHGFEIKGPNAGSKVYMEDVETGSMEVEIEDEEKAIHVNTQQGPRSALKRVDFVTQATLDFEIWVLITDPRATNHIGEEEIVEALNLAQENGLGANRSQGSGKFEVLEFEPIPDHPNARKPRAKPTKTKEAKAEEPEKKAKKKASKK